LYPKNSLLIKEITLVDEKYNIRNKIILATVSLKVEVNKKQKIKD
jgi:hypothetical protein